MRNLQRSPSPVRASSDPGTWTRRARSSRLAAEAFENTSGTGIETVLNQLPQFVPGSTQFTSGIQSGAASTPGAATLNLRGLGPNRNLVLIDGRRAQPANATLAVDINTIPSAAIENVEVITGGASAVYGPDAMAGVVNFVLKKNFQGLDIDMQTGTSQEGDGADTRVSALAGMNSADGRGNIMVGIDWTKRDGVLQANRDFYVNGWMDPSNPGGGFIVPRGITPASTAATGPRRPRSIRSSRRLLRARCRPARSSTSTTTARPSLRTMVASATTAR